MPEETNFIEVTLAKELWKQDNPNRTHSWSVANKETKKKYRYRAKKLLALVEDIKKNREDA
jgi:hypothetical protein